MVQIQNSSTVRELIKAAGLTAGDGIPTRLAESVVPVIDINPSHARVCDIVILTAPSSSGNATIYTTPSDKDFYLVSASLGVIKDATCNDATGNASSIVITVNSVQQSLLQIAGITATAQMENFSSFFPVPIKIDRNTAIVLSGATFTLGVKVRSAGLVGYTVEPFESRP